MNSISTSIAAIAVMALGVTASFAADYPQRTVSFIVPAAPGGGTDFVARLMADGLSRHLDGRFVVDNRPGANGIIAMRDVATAAPDGHTLAFISSGTIATNPFLYDDVGFDPVADFMPVSLPVSFFQVLAVNPDQGNTTLPELLEQARLAPGTVKIGNGGLGGTSHLATELLANLAEVEFSIIPYRGTAPAIAAVLGGELTGSFTGLPAGAPHFESGGAIPMAITSAKRSDLLPDVPTIAETVPGYEMDGWFALFAPAGTSPEIIAMLSEGIDEILADPEVRNQLVDLAYEIIGGGPEPLRQVLEADLARYEALVRDANITIE